MTEILQKQKWAGVHFTKLFCRFRRNGSGKSSTCDVLKSVSQNKDFQIIPPTLAKLQIHDGTNKTK